MVVEAARWSEVTTVAPAGVCEDSGRGVCRSV